MDIINKSEPVDWSKVAHKFHPSWEGKLRPFIESEKYREIRDQIRAQTERGKKIVPVHTQTFRCFLETPLDEMKVCMLGLAPYHTLKDGKILADGILMSSSNVDHLPPSLVHFYNGMEKELYPDSETGILRRADLSYLCHQGILMFNASLTTEILKAGSHMKLWEPFTKYIFEEVLSTAGVPVVYFGEKAAKFSRYYNSLQWQFEVSHPASAAYGPSGTEWDSEGVFTKVNRVLKDYNNYQITWAELLPF